MMPYTLELKTVGGITHGARRHVLQMRCTIFDIIPPVVPGGRHIQHDASQLVVHVMN